MSEQNENQGQQGLEQGTYEIIRGRLDNYGNDLKSRLNQLNDQRKAVFGAVETQLIATEHISTEHSCEPRDMVPIGDRFIFGYNVHIGLKTETVIEDVFSIYEYSDRTFKEASSQLLRDQKFIDDFKNLYKYYRDARFTQFVVKDGYLYFVFQIGKSVSDIKTFKWLIQPGHTLKYIDSRSEHEVKQPDQYGFRWKRPTRDHFRDGQHPHISIEDKVFVETVGGDLTIKIEDNTDSGLGIYAEPVDFRDQSLGDADISYALIGDIIVLRILPYQEKDFRYLIYNHKVKHVLRADALEQACVLLPEEQGIIFPQGYYLQSGEYKLFDFPYEGLGFEKQITSPNGEDFLYIFYSAEKGIYTMLLYNIIAQQLAQPIHCSGYSIFDNGEMCVFRSDGEAKKNHGIQIWVTPFAHADQLNSAQKDSYLFKVGNKEIVTAMAECRTVIKLIEREDAYNTIYVDISKTVRGTLDAHHWITHKDAAELSIPLEQIETTAKSAIAEFEKVLRLKKTAREKVDELSEKMAATRQKARSSAHATIDEFVETLTNLRTLRGEIISAREMRYMDVATLEEMENEIIELQETYSSKCVDFLLTDNALKPYQEKVDAIENRLTEVKKVVEADELDNDIAQVSGELELLIDIVNSLNIEDSTVTTAIIDSITEIFFRFNRITADLKKARKHIFGAEAEGEFKSQLKLIRQGASNYINISDTPDKCDEYLNRLVIQLEELEGKFSDFPEFGMPLTEAREEIHNAFESHKLSLIEIRNNRSVAVQRSSERILQGIQRRLEQFTTTDEINAYLASDMLVQKVRDNVEKLLELDDSVKADDLKSQLKSLRDNALRQLRDKNDLFKQGEDIIQLGTHVFSVNTKELGVTLVQRGDDMCYHLTGTNFFETIKDETFSRTRPFWNQTVVSENADVYRSEYLAYTIFRAAETGNLVLEEDLIDTFKLSELNNKKRIALVQQFMASRYEERYVKGVHDADAAKLLKTLIDIHIHADLLIYPSELRAYGRFFWQVILSEEERQNWQLRLNAFALMHEAFEHTKTPKGIRVPLAKEIAEALEIERAEECASYLFLELTKTKLFAISPEANDLRVLFHKWLKKQKLDKQLSSAIQDLNEQPRIQLQVIEEWLLRFSETESYSQGFIKEAAVSILSDERERLVDVRLNAEIPKLIGEHERIKQENLAFDYNSFIERLGQFEATTVPAYRDYQHQKHEFVEQFKKEIRLSSFEPKIMTSFVRNKLIDQVYLPLIGNNLAKQIGTAGDEKRTDLMGMLLLISPPGYGKTTLMEYIAQRVGLIFVKINGPSLGHDITSVDPMSASNSAAREELNKLNLAFEMGDNVMIYLDDIQHCNPEFLQKFISLCDGQRKIEGVYKGENKTYDFRGRKVMVVMAGNPYTESGERFQIPDMLANRADIYNLGDVIGGKQEVFELSYVENCLTSNSILARLNNKSFNDIYHFIKIAKEGPQEGLEFEANYSSEEMEDYVNLLKRVLTVRDIVVKVNLEYIRSASTEDQYRTVPAFKLQGSYRDMNKIVEKLVPLMNDEELQTLIVSHYENESQTLTSSAESSLLRFKELFGVLTDEETTRWEELKTTFKRNQQLRGIGGETNEMAHVISQMEQISESLKGISEGINRKNDKG